MSQDTNLGYRSNFPLTKILDRLYLGGFQDALNLRGQNPLGITHICNCTSEKLDLPRAKFNIIQMDQLDGHEWHTQKLYGAGDWIHQALRGGGKVLVHCHAGASRSPTLVACYLYTCGFGFYESLDELRKQRPIINPAPAIVISAKRAFGITPVA